MKLIVNLIAVAFLTFYLSGCIVVGGHSDGHENDWEERQRDNLQAINDLSVKTLRSTVLKQLGAPDFSEAFMKGDDEYRILFYRTRHKHADGETTLDETTPLIFLNDKLIGWGETTLANIVRP